MKKTTKVRIVLVRPRNPNNIGAVARALANFGFDDLAVVDPYEPIWRETRSAPGAESIVRKAKRFDTVQAATKGYSWVIGTSSFHQRPFAHQVVALPELNAYVENRPGGLVLLFGSERSGLSNAELAACRAVVHIPTNPKTPSMNLAQAVAVVLYGLSIGGNKPAKASTGVALDAVIREVVHWAEKTGYMPGLKPAVREGRIRQALADVSAGERGHRLLLSWIRWVGKSL